MPFVKGRCPKCGKLLAVDDSKKVEVCQFCGGTFVVNESIGKTNGGDGVNAVRINDELIGSIEKGCITTKNKKKSIKIVSIVVCICFVIVLVFLGLTHANLKQIFVQNTTTEKENAVVVYPDDEFTQNVAENDNTIKEEYCEFTDVESNSILSDIYDNGGINEYGPHNVLDSSLTTCWAEGDSGSGQGCYIKLYGDEIVTVNKIEIVNGYSKSEELFYKNNRVKELRISFSDGTEKNIILSGEFSEQPNHIILDEPIQTTYIKFEIISVYKGNLYDDTCISEIVVS